MPTPCIPVEVLSCEDSRYVTTLRLKYSALNVVLLVCVYHMARTVKINGESLELKGCYSHDLNNVIWYTYRHILDGVANGLLKSIV